MMFLRSNHIKEFTHSYGMRARWPRPLQEASVIAFLGVLTLLPAGGSSQLTMQCETAVMRANEKNILHHARVSPFPSCCRLYLRRMLLARRTHRFRAFCIARGENIIAVSLADGTDGPMSAACLPAQQ